MSRSVVDRLLEGRIGSCCFFGEYRSASSRNTAFVVAQIFSVTSPKLPVPRLLGRLPSTKCRLQFDGTARALRASGQDIEEVMLSVHIENIGDMAVVECEDRVVRSEAAFKLREAVTSQGNARIIVLDLSEVRRHRKQRTRHARVSAAMGVRPRHSTEAIQSHQIGAGQTGARRLGARVRHCHA